MSDTPCVDGCGQDAATIERLRERLAKVEALADEWEAVADQWPYAHWHDSQKANAKALRAALAPQNHPRSAASAPEAPGQAGRDERGPGGDSGPCAAPSPMTGKPCQRLAGHERYAPQHWGPACGDEWEATDARP